MHIHGMCNGKVATWYFFFVNLVLDSVVYLLWLLAFVWCVLAGVLLFYSPVLLAALLAFCLQVCVLACMLAFRIY